MSALRDGLKRGADGRVRCWWCGDAEDYVRYHDAEWGVPVTDDIRLFEKLSLEGFQAGLSWITILRKREAFRRGFAGFDPAAVARFGSRDIARLLRDAGIVRHRGKIEAVINNARRYPALREEFGSLASFIWSFEPGRAERGVPRTQGDIPPMTPSASAMSKALKARGWKFVGPTTMYALFQAMGLVNDHLEGCFRRRPVAALRHALRDAE
ncbi:MAG: DNA-3-methyladenine glycosylase I [Gemmatimonadales bacterium]|nr:DNA-3-methyladenine glycosylase I [Gemmatimonadales bacterium]